MDIEHIENAPEEFIDTCGGRQFSIDAVEVMQREYAFRCSLSQRAKTPKVPEVQPTRKGERPARESQHGFPRLDLKSGDMLGLSLEGFVNNQ
jgi:hypothetical protein